MPAGPTREMEGGSQARRWALAAAAPDPRLRPFVVGDYVGYAEWTPGRFLRRELPPPFVVVAIEFGPPLRVIPGGDVRRLACHRGGFVAPLDGSFALCEHDGYQSGIQVNLTAVAARRLLGVPLCALGAEVVALRDLLPARHRCLPERLQELPDWDARFALVDAVLLEMMAAARVDTRAVSWAVARIEASAGAIGIGELARDLGYSSKHLIRLFRDQVGVPPKTLARMVRFDALVRRVRAGARAPWVELALECGYYDQAHLARDVREFAGLTPSALTAVAADFFADAP